MQGAADSEKAGVQIPSLRRICTILSAPGPQPATPGVSGCSAHPSAGPLPPDPSLPAEEGAGAEEWETWAHFLSGQDRARRPRPLRPARSAPEAAEPQHREGDGVQRGCAAAGAGVQGYGARARQPRPQRVPSGERVKRAGGGAGASPARRVAGRGWGGGQICRGTC